MLWQLWDFDIHLINIDTVIYYYVFFWEILHCYLCPMINHIIYEEKRKRKRKNSNTLKLKELKNKKWGHFDSKKILFLLKVPQMKTLLFEHIEISRTLHS